MKTWKQFLSLVLVTCLLTSLFGVASAAEPQGQTQLLDSTPGKTQYEVKLVSPLDGSFHLGIQGPSAYVKIKVVSVADGTPLDPSQYTTEWTTSTPERIVEIDPNETTNEQASVSYTHLTLPTILRV